MKFVFFGSSDISISSLEYLLQKNLLPSLIVTKPDSPQGRGLELKPTVVKEWALTHSIECITPDLMKDEVVLEKIKSVNAEVGVLVSYGKLIPNHLINVFPKGILNLHPSLLPLLRGPAPIEFSILNDLREQIGVSIMLLDQGMDTGPVLAQKQVEVAHWPLLSKDLYDTLSRIGGELLASTLIGYIEGEITPTPQDDSKATYSRIIEKKDGEISLSNDAYQNFLKFCAFDEWPGVFFFDEIAGKKMRIKITDAVFKDGEFKILKVIPEGKKEMDYESFLRGKK